MDVQPETQVSRNLEVFGRKSEIHEWVEADKSTLVRNPFRRTNNNKLTGEKSGTS